MTLYVVEINGGEYEDSWTSVGGVYSTKELALKAVADREANRAKQTSELKWLEKVAKDWKAARGEDFYDKLSAARAAKEKLYYGILEIPIDQPLNSYFE